MAFLRAKPATSAVRFSGQFDSHAAAKMACGAAGNAEAMLNGPRCAKADGRGNTRTPKRAALQRQDNSKIIARSPCGKNSLAVSQKQRTCRRKKRLSRSTPHPRFLEGSKLKWPPQQN